MIPLQLLGFLHMSIMDVLDIVVVAVIIYIVFRWLRGSSAMNILIAIVALFVIRFAAAALSMKLLSALMDAVINVGAVALIVIFQPEIRQFLGRVGRGGAGLSWWNRLLGRKEEGLSSKAVNEIIEACSDNCNCHLILHIFLESCTEDELYIACSLICDKLCSCIDIGRKNVLGHCDVDEESLCTCDRCFEQS